MIRVARARIIKGVLHSNFGTVSDKPYFITPAGRVASVVEKNLLTVRILARDDVGVTQWRVKFGALPPGMTLSQTGLITGIAPDLIEDIEYTFTIEIADVDGNKAQRTFSILVIGVDDPPYWITPPGNIMTFAEDMMIGQVAIPLVGADDGGQPLVFMDGGSLPNRWFIRPDESIVKGVPIDVMEDTTWTFSAFLVDSIGQMSPSRTFAFTVQFVNEPPIILTKGSGSANLLFDAGPSKIINFGIAADDDRPIEELVFTTTASLPNGFSFSSTGTLSGVTPGTIAADVTYGFPVVVTDRGGLSATKAFSFMFSRPNIAPTWVTPPGFLGAFIENTTMNATIVAVDDLTVAQYRPAAIPRVSGVGTFYINFIMPVGINLRATNAGAVISGSLPSVQTDTNVTLLLEAVDARGLTTGPSTFWYTVLNNNQPPIWESTAAIGPLAAGSTISGIGFEWSDDSDIATVSLINGSMPLGLMVDSVGEITGTLSTIYTDYATFDVTAVVTDVPGLSATRDFNVIVGPAGYDLTEQPSFFTTDFKVVGSLTYPLINFGTYLEGAITTLPIPVSPSAKNVSIVGDNIAGLGKRGKFKPVLANKIQRIVPEVEGQFRSFENYLIAVNGSLTATAIAQITVAGIANVAPTWLTPFTLSPVIEGSKFYYEFLAEDDEPGVDGGPTSGPGVSYSLISNNLSAYGSYDVALSAMEGSVPALTETVNGTIIIRATDGVGASTIGTFVFDLISPNNGPVWITPPGTVMTISGYQTVTRKMPNLLATSASKYTVVGSYPLPDGITLGSKNGYFAGRAPDIPRLTAPSLYPFAVEAMNAVGETSTRSFAIMVTPRINVAPTFVRKAGATLATVMEGTAAIVPVIADDDVPGVMVSIVDGSLPDGFTYTSVTPQLSIFGTLAPTEVDTAFYTITARATDIDGLSTNQDFVIKALRLDLPPTWGTLSNLGTFVVGSRISVGLPAFDDYGPLTFSGGWMPVSGSLSVQMTASLTSSGTVVGIAPRLADTVNYQSWTLRASVKDGRGQSPQGQKFFGITVKRDDLIPVWVTASSLGTFDELSDQKIQLLATDDSGPPKLEIIGGALPAGLVLTGTGYLLGKMPQYSSLRPTYTIIVRASDMSGNFADRTFTFGVRNLNNPPQWITSSNLGTYAAGSNVSLGLIAIDDSDRSLDFSLIQGPLPAALSLIQKGTLTGQLSEASIGVYPFSIRVVDDGQLYADRDFTMVVVPSDMPVWITPPNLGSYTEGVSVSMSLIASNAISYSVATLPPNFTFTSAGFLSSGSLANVVDDRSYSFTVTAINLANRTDQVFSIDVNAVPQITGPTKTFLGSYMEGDNVSFQFSATATPVVVSWTIASGSLPPGLSLDETTGVLSGTVGTVDAETPFAFVVQALSSRGVAGTANYSIDARKFYPLPFNGSFVLTLDDNSMPGAATFAAGAVVSNAVAKYGSTSLRTTGATNQYAGYNFTADFQSSSQQHTIEGWLYPTSLDGSIRVVARIIGRSATTLSDTSFDQTLVTQGGLIGMMYQASNGNLTFYWSNVSIPTDAWSHVAISGADFSSSNRQRYVHVNGVQVGGVVGGSGINPFAGRPAGNNFIFMLGGARPSPSNIAAFDGYTDGFAVTLGVMRYSLPRHDIYDQPR